MSSSMPCKDCASGTLHEGTPTGVVESIHGQQTYIANPPSGDPRAIIVIIPDAFGWRLPNSRILADNYAKRANVRVLMPDVMNDYYLPFSLLTQFDHVSDESQSMFKKIPTILRILWSFVPFLIVNRFGVTIPRVTAYLKSLRSSTPLPVGAAGFCWGGKHVIAQSHKQSNGDKPLIDFGFMAHPSALKLPVDFEKVEVPLSICHASKDFQLSMQAVDQIKELLAKQGMSEGKHEVMIVEGAAHGFAVRGNPADEKELECGLQAEDQAIAWFEKWI